MSIPIKKFLLRLLKLKLYRSHKHNPAGIKNSDLRKPAQVTMNDELRRWMAQAYSGTPSKMMDAEFIGFLAMQFEIGASISLI